MTETRKTLTLVGIALALLVLAWVTRPHPVTSAIVRDRGEPFFPEFTDPGSASSLEVVEFDEQTSLARPFKVLSRDGRWTIPSHDNYPADASNRLSSIAAAVIALRKADVATDNVIDEERCGVLDPLDDTLPTPKGRGTRMTVKGTNEKVLADIIVGRALEGRPSLRYVRLPAQTRTYVARVDNLNVSTRFEDWIERNLLLVDRDDIDQIVIRTYSTDPSSGRMNQPEMIVLRRIDLDHWAANDMAAGEQIDSFRMNLLITKLVELEIVDVRPKPVSMVASLTTPSEGQKLLQADAADLAGKGFSITATGQLLSSHGEVLVHTSQGIFYVLRLGEIAVGAASTPPLSPPATAEPRTTTSENRYLFISVGFDPKATQGTITRDVQARLDVLRARFAPWYYIISDESVRKIRLQRSDLVTSRKPPGA
jgi:hypothetical protein